MTTEGAFSVGRPEMLFEGDFVTHPAGDQSYDVALDGRFLMVRQDVGDQQQQLIVVTKFSEELKRLVPN